MSVPHRRAAGRDSSSHSPAVIAPTWRPSYNRKPLTSPSYLNSPKSRVIGALRGGVSASKRPGWPQPKKCSECANRPENPGFGA